MAYTTIKKPSDYFNTLDYNGNGSNRSIIDVGFQPDWVWLKRRDQASFHYIFDSIRGVQKRISSNSTAAETTVSTSLTSFDSDGFGLGTEGDVNESGGTYVAWNWKANGAGSANTDGSINSTVSANTTAGFSIVSYTGNGTGNSTIGHGLGTIPKFIIVKNLTTAQQWGTLSDSFNSASDPNILYLSNTTAEADDTNVWGTSANFTSSTFTVGDWNGSNQSGSNFIAYCWSEKQGFSKFGSYVGNGSTDGTFVYTGFKPAFVITKRTTDGSESWHIFDNKRNTFNEVNTRIQANSNGGEDTAAPLGDFVSNGFKIRGTGGGINVSGKNFIYMAFAEEPLVGDNPATAR